MTLPKILIKRAGEAGMDEETTEIPDLYGTVRLLKDREKAKEFKGELKMTASQIESGPSPPTGFRVDVQVGPAWQTMQPHHQHTSIATPRILDLDVNMTRLAAQEIISQVTRGPWNQLSKSLPELKTFRAGRFSTLMQKSISQPTPKAMHSIPCKRFLTLPPIASFYSQSNLTTTKREK
ncbi:uncharacterized protein LOC114574285 [Exaiptasia diaphana]|uniref:Uncharacterized protein n=1 Tax=Exaiptasia diaphana TaxID=2652724 RepID=A0A913YZ14_EXADI|nr:uncharacterized protein LOC114574285 [Exaiptasia diaphana]